MIYALKSVNFFQFKSTTDCIFWLFTETGRKTGRTVFFTFWDFGHGYLYGEHFAVDPSRRGGGTGTAVLDYIKGLGRPMLLEIELPVEDDEMTFRRKLFYERNGFILNPWHHVQPAYHDDSVPVEMHIMSWPYVFSKEEYETFRADQAGIMP